MYHISRRSIKQNWRCDSVTVLLAEEVGSHCLNLQRETISSRRTIIIYTSVSELKLLCAHLLPCLPPPTPFSSSTYNLFYLIHFPDSSLHCIAFYSYPFPPAQAHTHKYIYFFPSSTHSSLFFSAFYSHTTDDVCFVPVLDAKI